MKKKDIERKLKLSDNLTFLFPKIKLRKLKIQKLDS